MKRKIRKTGEIIDVISFSGSTTRNDVLDRISYIDSNGIEHLNEYLNYFWDTVEIDEKDEEFKSKRVDLLSILKKCPKGIELWSPLCGKCYYDGYSESEKILEDDNESEIYFITPKNSHIEVYRFGQYFFDEKDCCVIFPSENQKDWSKFIIPEVVNSISKEELDQAEKLKKERLSLLKNEISSRLPYGVIFGIKEDFISSKYSECYFKARSISLVPGDYEIICEAINPCENKKLGELTIPLDYIDKLYLWSIDAIISRKSTILNEFYKLFGKDFKLDKDRGLVVLTNSIDSTIINNVFVWAYKNNVDINSLEKKGIAFCYDYMLQNDEYYK